MPPVKSFGEPRAEKRKSTESAKIIAAASGLQRSQALAPFGHRGAGNAKVRVASPFERRKLDGGIPDRGALDGSADDLQPGTFLQELIEKCIAVAAADDINAADFLSGDFG